MEKYWKITSLPKIFSVLDKMAEPSCYFGPAAMIIGDLSAIKLNPEISPLQESISRYAASPDGWLEKLGMVLVAVAFFSIALSLLRIKKSKELQYFRIAGWLLVIVTIGFLMISIFNTNVIATIVNFHGIVHQITSGAVSVVFYAACLILMRLLFSREGFKLAGIYSGITFLVGLIVLVVLSYEYHSNEYVGLLERTIAGFNLVWVALAGPRVIKLAKILQ